MEMWNVGIPNFFFFTAILIEMKCVHSEVIEKCSSEKRDLLKCVVCWDYTVYQIN